jgi:hypothetical protein
MIENGQLQRVKTEYHGFPQTRYLTLYKVNITKLKAREKEIIEGVFELISDWFASAISNYSHKDRHWLASKEGKNINYELVFYRDTPFSVRNCGDETEQ